MKELGIRLKQVQAERGLSQLQMANLLDITPASLSNYINDKKSPSIDVVADMAKRLDVSIGWLLGEETVKRGNILKGGNVSYAYLISLIEEMINLDGSKFVLDVNAATAKAEIEIHDDTVVRYFILANVLKTHLTGAFDIEGTLKDHLQALDNVIVNDSPGLGGAKHDPKSD